MNHIEIIDPDAPAPIPAQGIEPTVFGRRPDHTLADWIILGGTPGVVEVTEMAYIKPLHGEDCPRKSCYLCSIDETTVREFAQGRQETYQLELMQYGVEWDPTITF